MVDVVIAGGGVAGLSAALVLGRARRTTLVLDTGEPRNRYSRKAHGGFTRDGTSPEELLRIAREQPRPYDTVTLQALGRAGGRPGRRPLRRKALRRGVGPVPAAAAGPRPGRRASGYRRPPGPSGLTEAQVAQLKRQGNTSVNSVFAAGDIRTRITK